MPSCVFRYCHNHEAKINKTQGITYHKFPTDNIRLLDWITIVREQRSELYWQPSKSSRICSEHFKATDKYESKTGRTQLKNDAVPIIEEPIEYIIQNSPSSLDLVSVPELKQILESPKESALRKRVCELTSQKKQLIKTVRTLKQHNKRLKERIARVGVILKDLKKRKIISREQFIQYTGRKRKMSNQSLKLKTEIIDLSINRITS